VKPDTLSHVEDRNLFSGEALARWRLVQLLQDPDSYFARARREAREHARRLVIERGEEPLPR
jgi:hypothetical protein